MGFDAHHPPLARLIDDCVHCGFCLPTCPTYALSGEEMESPRGRIHLIAQVLDGAPLDGVVTSHLDSCLSCMGCLTACPSGVHYDELIEAARGQIERQVTRSWRERALRAVVFAVFPHPRRLRVARAVLAAGEMSGLRTLLRRPGVAARLPELFRTLESIAPQLSRTERVPSHVAAVGERRGTVGMLTGCVQSVFFSSVNAATSRVLAAEGFDVVIPPSQGCCGALSGHVGRDDEAIAFAKSTIDCFARSGVETVVVNSAGCGSAMKKYHHLLRDEPEYETRAARFASGTRDFAEFLDEVGPRATRHRVPMTIAYHDACHLAHAQGVRSAPRRLLQAIPDLLVREITEGDMCCGSAGVYNLTQPVAARALGDRKAGNVVATGAEILVTANPGCMMQIRAAMERRGAPLAVAHIAEVLDASLRGVSLSTRNQLRDHVQAEVR